MDADELATPGYAVLSPAIATKLATLEKGQLMVRHPHFTQPIFVRSRVRRCMRGRDGVERFPQAADASLRRALLRGRLRRSTRPSRSAWLQDVVALVDEDDLLRARNATLQARPRDVQGFFASSSAQRSSRRRPPRPCPRRRLRALPADDPYGL